MTGNIGILNVGAGDTKITFDKDKPEEVKRASFIIEDMLKRGFAIFVQIGNDDKGPLYRRAEGFDSETCEYLIVGIPENDPAVTVEVKKEPKRRGRKPQYRVPATSTEAVSVGRSAGG